MDVHLVLRVGTAKVVFGGFVKAVFVVLEQVRELQELVLSIFNISRLARLEASLKRGVDLSQGERHIGQKQVNETNLLDLLNGCVLEVCHGGHAR